MLLQFQLDVPFASLQIVWKSLYFSGAWHYMHIHTQRQTLKDIRGLLVHSPSLLVPSWKCAHICNASMVQFQQLTKTNKKAVNGLVFPLIYTHFDLFKHWRLFLERIISADLKLLVESWDLLLSDSMSTLFFCENTLTYLQLLRQTVNFTMVTFFHLLIITPKHVLDCYIHVHYYWNQPMHHACSRKPTTCMHVYLHGCLARLNLLLSWVKLGLNVLLLQPQLLQLGLTYSTYSSFTSLQGSY